MGLLPCGSRIREPRRRGAGRRQSGVGGRPEGFTNKGLVPCKTGRAPQRGEGERGKEVRLSENGYGSSYAASAGPLAGFAGSGFGAALGLSAFFGGVP